ncbi:hydroxyethylthiazole kinase-like uncharacterized protein yjeF [Altererythrobacter atlanticus]|uniref:ADP-dependent (S)-NAD(P)H-hydrate dehydratase n=2 Tax=Croceibacterium atlanticum TaxID=1267766 RepID=A0A0F7KRH8_9SPHN|nr:Bifunctional NAD(P)H-hydrate repair enzyme Nnr [Croceibacterium atlanticum]MBB5733190.1 hydroxyethylthiazole kinase-like uncharacterized protein yjeF [Croceibacterium atlanticum]
MRAAEQSLIDGGETVESLMDCAGKGAAEWVWRVAGGRSVTVLCGPGNNGGDGYVIARELLRRGLPVSIVAPLEPATDAARAARAAYHGPFAEMGKGGVFVDCLFGSGLGRPLSDELAALVCRLAEDHATRVAIDLPSGIESDSGQPLNDGLPDYDLTISLGAWKYAHWLMPAMQAMGERRLVDIGIGRVADAGTMIRRPHLPTPARDAHKYTRGLLAIVGGAMPGAAMLACRAAAHGGAGYIKLFADHHPQCAPDELVIDTSPLEHALADRRIAALLVGPGLTRDDAAQHRLSAVLARDLPTVLDADALVLLRPAMLAARTAPLILTPHSGELAQLFSAFGIEGEDRIGHLHELARKSGAVVAAKGPDTLVAAPDGELRIARPAPSWLSTAGTGDVLAGLIASRLANGAAPVDAAAQAIWLHGEAAHQAGPVFTPSDLVRSLAGAYAACL